MFCIKHMLQVALLALSTAGIMLPASSFAGDVADREIIGFSADGGYFAFEQYGYQDGSGFPYSEIFVIDTERNAWVGGSPFEVLIKDEKGSLEEARTQSRTKATALLSEHGINVQGRILASNPVTELSANPKRVEVNPESNVANIVPPILVKLRTFSLESPLCRTFTQDPILGFQLTIGQKGQRAATVHKDDRIPKSRGCPLRYAIRDVIRYRRRNYTVYIVLISVFQHGFEGPDVRYIAVPYREF